MSASKAKTTTKKPKWSVVTYKQIEAKRVELGLSKSAIAVALGVTNSTLHNWRRGTTVPHPSQQEQLREILDGLTGDDTTTGARSTTRGGTRRGSKGAKAKAEGRRAGSSADGSTVGTEDSAGTLEHKAGDVDGGSHVPSHGYAESHPLFPSLAPTVPAESVEQGIAAVTAAFIAAQTTPPSAAFVFEFVRGLRDVFSEENPPER